MISKARVLLFVVVKEAIAINFAEMWLRICILHPSNLISLHFQPQDSEWLFGSKVMECGWFTAKYFYFLVF